MYYVYVYKSTMGRPGMPRGLVTCSFQSPQTTGHCCKNDQAESNKISCRKVV